MAGAMQGDRFRACSRICDQCCGTIDTKEPLDTALAGIVIGDMATLTILYRVVCRWDPSIDLETLGSPVLGAGGR